MTGRQPISNREAILTSDLATKEDCGVFGLVKIQRETAVADVNALPQRSL
jgi:hypothetical protein